MNAMDNRENITPPLASPRHINSVIKINPLEWNGNYLV